MNDVSLLNVFKHVGPPTMISKNNEPLFTYEQLCKYVNIKVAEAIEASASRAWVAFIGTCNKNDLSVKDNQQWNSFKYIMDLKSENNNSR